MTCEAVMVVMLVVPRTRTRSPMVTALAEVVGVPFRYCVAEVSSIVTFCPVEVVIAKPDADTLVTVPSAPPAAGAERAFDAPPDPAPLVEPPGKWTDVVVEIVGAVVVVPDAATPTEIPVAATTSAVAEIHRLLRPDSNRRSGRAGLGTVPSGEVGSLLVMMALLLIR